MAGTYDKSVTRADAQPTIPEDVRKALLNRLTEKSAVLSTCRIVPMSTGQARMPAVAGLASAYFVNGDSGLKQTTDFSFRNKELIAEEIAALVVIPDNVDADSEEDLWAWAETEVVNAVYRKVDQAILFGHDRATWPKALAEFAEDAGRIIELGTSSAAEGGATGDLDLLLEEVEESGGSATSILAARKLKGALRRSRNTTGDKLTSGLNEYDGVPINYSAAGAFTPGAGQTLAIAADFDKVLIGLRQDITMDVFSEGIISDENGKVIYNSMQQDGKVLRVVFRLAYQVDDSLTTDNRNVAGTAADGSNVNRVPVAVLNAPAA